MAFQEAYDVAYRAARQLPEGSDAGRSLLDHFARRPKWHCDPRHCLCADPTVFFRVEGHVVGDVCNGPGVSACRDRSASEGAKEALVGLDQIAIEKRHRD